MDQEKLKVFKRNSKNAVTYMKSVEKEYMDGKTLKDQMIFLRKFEKNHSLDDIDYLYNEMDGHKESRLLFTNGFFGITIPSYAMIFTFLGVMVSALFGFTSSISMKLIELELNTEDKNIESALDLFIQAHSSTMLRFGVLFILFLFVLLCMFWYRNNGDINRIRYLVWLKTIKGFKDTEMPSENNQEKV